MYSTYISFLVLLFRNPEMNSTTTGEAESAVSEFVSTAWMVRPCEMYKDEYRECQSIRGRFHQKFTTGTTKDCASWKEDFLNCLAWENTSSKPALESIVKHEKSRMATRISNVLKNDVWKLRDSPPPDWNDPLPEHLQKLNEGVKFKTSGH